MIDQELQLLQRFEKDSKWFHSNTDLLRKNGFMGKIVAIKEGKVISSGENIDIVIQSVEKQKENPKFIFMKIINPNGFNILL